LYPTEWLMRDRAEGYLISLILLNLLSVLLSNDLVKSLLKR
jgi:hypothetical protein